MVRVDEGLITRVRVEAGLKEAEGGNQQQHEHGREERTAGPV